jgi:hypothetical protein
MCFLVNWDMNGSIIMNEQNNHILRIHQVFPRGSQSFLCRWQKQPYTPQAPQRSLFNCKLVGFVQTLDTRQSSDISVFHKKQLIDTLSLNIPWGTMRINMVKSDMQIMKSFLMIANSACIVEMWQSEGVFYRKRVHIGFNLPASSVTNFDEPWQKTKDYILKSWALSENAVTNCDKPW